MFYLVLKLALALFCTNCDILFKYLHKHTAMLWELKSITSDIKSKLNLLYSHENEKPPAHSLEYI